MLYHDGNAQNFNEWFQQKKTQKEYLIGQIAAFQVYMDYLQKGYSIARKGLTLIGDIKSGEFNLHEDYFSSLKEVNPEIKNYIRVAEIILLETKIIRACQKSTNQVKQNKIFDQEKREYLARVLARLMDGSELVIEELSLVVTPGKFEMTDDERINRIDALYKDMVDKYSFLSHFTSQVQMLANARTNEANDIRKTGLMNGLKNEER